MTRRGLVLLFFLAVLAAPLAAPAKPDVVSPAGLASMAAILEYPLASMTALMLGGLGVTLVHGSLRRRTAKPPDRPERRPHKRERPGPPLPPGLTSLILDIDLAGRVRRVVFADAPGPEALAGQDFLQLMAQADRAPASEALARLAGHQGAEEFAFVSPTPDGPRRMQAYLTAQESGSVLAVIRDVSSRAASEDHFRELLRLADCIIVRLDATGRISFINDFGAAFFGYGRAELIGRHVLGSIVPERDAAGRDLGAMVADICRDPEAHARNENENMRKDGERVTVAWSNRPIRENGRLTGVLCVGADMTLRRRMAEELRLRERHFAAIIEKSSDGLCIVDENGLVLYESPAAAARRGRRPGESVGEDVLEHVLPEDRPAIRALLAKSMTDPTASPLAEYRARAADGAILHLEAKADNCLADEAVAGIIISTRDVSERKGFEDQLRRQAFSDPLTGLPNRALFLDRLGHALTRLKRRPGALLAVLFIDLDRFKLINDSLGHATGDALLVDIAARLRACLRGADTVARFGGDEFILLLDDMEDERQAIRVAGRIKDVLQHPFRTGHGDVFPSASIGIVYSSPNYDTPEQMIRDADTAMFKAKAAGRGGYRVFHSRMHQQAARLLALETDLRKAVAGDELELHYQPILDIEASRVLGFEALARWRGASGAFIPPLEFIPVAEETGLIARLGEYVLAEACRALAGLNRDAPKGAGYFVSVNLSARQIEDPDLPDRVAAILDHSGLRPDLLTLEITESAIAANPDRAAAILRDLKTIGARLAIDDFGTGYSSLSHLHAFPFDTIKIDRGFVSALSGEPGVNTRIVQTIIALARNLDMSVVAEGIETTAQLETLRGLDCRLGQGYLFARPMEFQAAAALAGGDPIMTDAFPDPADRRTREETP